MANLRDTLMFPVEKSALFKDFAREVHGLPVQESESIIIRMLDEKKFESILHDYWNSASDKFLKFGIISAGFIGFMIIWQFMKYCADVVIRVVTRIAQIFFAFEKCK